MAMSVINLLISLVEVLAHVLLFIKLLQVDCSSWMLVVVFAHCCYVGLKYCVCGSLTFITLLFTTTVITQCFWTLDVDELEEDIEDLPPLIDQFAYARFVRKNFNEQDSEASYDETELIQDINF